MARHPCLLLEGRFPIAECSGVALDMCSRGYTADASRRLFHFCGQNDGHCTTVSGPHSCGVDAALSRIVASRQRLEEHIAALRNRSMSTALEEATCAISETFELAAHADAALSTDAIEAMLRYQLVARDASPFGWWDAQTVSLRQVAAHMVFDELAAVEALLQRDNLHAEARLGGLSIAPEVSRWYAAPDLRADDLQIQARYLYRTQHDDTIGGVATAAASPPLFVAGFNSLARVFHQQHSSSAEGADEWQMDRNAARHLQAMGMNMVVLFASPARLLLPNLTMSEPEMRQLRDELRSADDNGFSTILHVPSELPPWALEADPTLGTRDGQHSISYDISHPQAMPLMEAFIRGLHGALPPPPPRESRTPADHTPGGCRPAVFAVQLMNEPALRGTASAYAKAGFARWLRRQYGGRLPLIRAAWHASRSAITSFEDAAELATPRASARQTAEPPVDSGGAARIADWFQYNEERVTAWQANLTALFWQASPCHRTMAKLNQANSIDERLHDDGIDTAALSTLHNVSATRARGGKGGEQGVQMRRARVGVASS